MTAGRARAHDDLATWRVLIGVLVIAWCVVAAQVPGLPQGLDLPGAAAISLIGVAVAGLVAGMPRGLAVALVLAGVAWLSPTILPRGVGTPPGDATTGGLAPLLPILLVPPVAWMLGRRRSWRSTLALLVLPAGGLLAVAARAVTLDPFFVPGCVACTHVPALLEPGPEGRLVLRTLEATMALAAGSWLLGLGLAGLARHRPRDRVAVALGAAVTGGATVVTISLVLLRMANRAAWLGTARVPVGELLGSLMALGVLALAAGILVRSVTVGRARWRIRALVGRLGPLPAPGSLAAELARATGDPTIRLAYRLPDEDRHVDAEGRILAAASPGELAVAIGPADAPIAAIRHQPGLDADVILAALTPSLIVALDNERLRAARLARMRELQESRARIVAVADAERRRLERDLHDGAQQRLLGIAFDLRVRRAEADAAGRTALAARLARAEAAALSGIEDIRRLARGVYPVVLAQAGLDAALRSLAEDAPIPVDIDAELPDALPPAVELAAYHVVAGTLAVAAAADATELSVTVRAEGPELRLVLADDAASPPERFLRLADRVGAAGGRWLVGGGPGGGTRLEVELPCA